MGAVEALGLLGIGEADEDHGHVNGARQLDGLGRQLLVGTLEREARSEGHLAVDLTEGVQRAGDPGGVHLGRPAALEAGGSGELADHADPDIGGPR